MVRLDFDLIDSVIAEQEKDRKIVLPDEVKDNMKGGCQVATVLSVGPSAFDDAAIEEQKFDWTGRQVITTRYPGHAIDYDPYSTGPQSIRMRVISCDEVRAVVALDDEEGADV